MKLTFGANHGDEGLLTFRGKELMKMRYNRKVLYIIGPEGTIYSTPLAPGMSDQFEWRLQRSCDIEFVVELIRTRSIDRLMAYLA